MDNAANAIKLSSGSNSVTFVLRAAGEMVRFSNSHGECATLPLTEARDRIACLVAAGWRVA